MNTLASGKDHESHNRLGAARVKLERQLDLAGITARVETTSNGRIEIVVNTYNAHKLADRLPDIP